MMADTKNAPKRRWMLLSARVLLVALTAIVVLAVGQMLVADYRQDADLSKLSDAEKSILPWLLWLRRVLPLVLLASVLCATYAVFRSTGRDLRRMLWAALAGFVVFTAGIAGFYVLFVYWYIPAAQPPPPNLRNRPGTLVSLGQTTPDAVFTTLSGRSVQLADLRGRVVLLNFFATWCGPCKWELPKLQEIWNEYRGNDDFEMFAIDLEESAEIVQEFKEDHGFTFPVACDPDRSTYGQFATKSIPRTFLISREGEIVYEVTGYYPGENHHTEARTRTRGRRAK